MSLIKVLSSETRRKIIKILIKKEMHISGLAKELNLSKTIVARHVRVLEKHGIVERKKFGRTHVLKIKIDKIYETFDDFKDIYNVKAEKGVSVLDVLKKVMGVEVEKIGDREYVTKIDGERGWYIYEVNGEMPNISMNKFILEKDSKIVLKKLIPVKRKEINVKIMDGNEKIKNGNKKKIDKSDKDDGGKDNKNV